MDGDNAGASPTKNNDNRLKIAEIGFSGATKHYKKNYSVTRGRCWTLAGRIPRK